MTAINEKRVEHWVCDNKKCGCKCHKIIELEGHYIVPYGTRMNDQTRCVISKDDSADFKEINAFDTTYKIIKVEK